MKLLLFIILIFNNTPTCQNECSKSRFEPSKEIVKKGYIPFENLVHASELIVFGDIVNISDSTYTFNIKESIKGDFTDKIEVNKFKEWICDTRIVRHTVGEQIILFLEKNSKDEWITIYGSTGELIVINGEIDVHRHSIVRGNYAHEYILPYEIIEATKLLLNCFNLNNENMFEILCEQKLIESKTKENSFLKDAIDAMISFDKIIKPNR